METVTDFIFLGSKITADGDCNHEIKRRLLLGRKVMTNLDIILKSRDITLLAKFCLVKAMVFLVVMYDMRVYKGIWVPKNWCFWTVVLEKTLESPLDCKEIKPVNPRRNQSWIFVGMLKLKLQYFGHLMQRTHWKRRWCWERFKAGGGQDDRGWDGWITSPTQWTCVWVSSGSWWWTWKPGVLQSTGSQRVGHDWVTELNWIRLCILRHFV